MEVNVSCGNGFANLTDEDVAACRDRILELEQRHPEGVATPEAIIEDARKKNSPLHRYYEWDVDVAFEQYLLDRTRQIVTAIRYTVHYNQQTVKVRGFENIVTREGVRGYKSVESIKSDDFYRKQTIEEALATIARFEQKYRDLMEFFGLASRLSTIRNKIEEGRATWENAAE